MKTKFILPALLLLGILGACERIDDPIYAKTDDKRFPIIVANTTFTTPTLAAAGTTTVAKGATIKIEFNFLQTDPLKEIQFLQKIGTADSTVISTTPYLPAFSKSKQCDTLIYNYVVPATIASATTVTIRARAVTTAGLFKDRSIAYKVQ